ncbi:zinc finger BED domain-containing protein 4-like [Drosophila santomea]|uniref:zinc finger BED domain-containing protein 4-like n=1 Tax=Drosophila santomea TaxID=129105 RepID=UPI001CCC3E8A|nr:zinc finger BED domain-containing protein 4-like [Drosophila santomea]
MHFKHSTAMMDLLRKAQADEGTPEGKIKTLVQNIETRWNSCLDMMQAFLNLANKVAPFKAATEQISGEQYVTVSLVILIALISNQIQKLNMETEDGKRAKEAFVRISNKRFQSYHQNKILVKSSFLDPRFKKMYLAPMMVKEAVFEINNENTMSAQERRISEVDSSKDLGDFMSCHNSSIAKELDDQNMESKELKLYFSFPQAAWESNPIEVWKGHKATMPGLYRLAMRYLITPGSSVPSERLASAIKWVVCDARSRMTA